MHILCVCVCVCVCVRARLPMCAFAKDSYDASQAVLSTWWVYQTDHCPELFVLNTIVEGYRESWDPLLAFFQYLEYWWSSNVSADKGNILSWKWSRWYVCWWCFLIHTSIIWIYAMRHVPSVSWPTVLQSKIVTLDITHKLFNQILSYQPYLHDFH